MFLNNLNKNKIVWIKCIQRVITLELVLHWLAVRCQKNHIGLKQRKKCTVACRKRPQLLDIITRVISNLVYFRADYIFGKLAWQVLYFLQRVTKFECWQNHTAELCLWMHVCASEEHNVTASVFGDSKLICSSPYRGRGQRTRGSQRIRRSHVRSVTYSILLKCICTFGIIKAFICFWKKAAFIWSKMQ